MSDKTKHGVAILTEALKIMSAEASDALYCLESLSALRLIEQKTPKEYGEYLQKKRQGKRRYR